MENKIKNVKKQKGKAFKAYKTIIQILKNSGSKIR